MNVGRNEPCPCGSALKYKRCCAEGDAQRESLARKLIVADQTCDAWIDSGRYTPEELFYATEVRCVDGVWRWLADATLDEIPEEIATMRVEGIEMTSAMELVELGEHPDLGLVRIV